MPTKPIETECLFCHEALSLIPRHREVVARCSRCSVGLVLTAAPDQARAVIATALSVSEECLTLSTSPALTKSSPALYLVCGWDPDEALSVPTAARILRRHRQSVYEKVTQFDGAHRATPKYGRRGHWRIPRHAVQTRLLRP